MDTQNLREKAIYPFIIEIMDYNYNNRQWET